MQRSAAHPSKLEEVEGYKKFVFPQESWFKISRGVRVET
jgi:hypothetical protein